MINFFDELKRFIEMHQDGLTNGLFFEFYGAKIPYHIAEQIYYRVNEVEMWKQEYEETLAETCDYNRLLREENARLRGN